MVWRFPPQFLLTPGEKCRYALTTTKFERGDIAVALKKALAEAIVKYPAFKVSPASMIRLLPKHKTMDPWRKLSLFLPQCNMFVSDSSFYLVDDDVFPRSLRWQSQSNTTKTNPHLSTLLFFVYTHSSFPLGDDNYVPSLAVLNLPRNHVAVRAHDHDVRVRLPHCSLAENAALKLSLIIQHFISRANIPNSFSSSTITFSPAAMLNFRRNHVAVRAHDHDFRAGGPRRSLARHGVAMRHDLHGAQEPRVWSPRAILASAVAWSYWGEREVRSGEARG